MQVRSALDVFRRLNGVFCAYKPAGITTLKFENGIVIGLTREINKLEQRPLKQRIVYHEDNWGSGKPLASLVDDLSDHILVQGPRFHEEDFIINHGDSLHFASSGLSVFGINECPQLEEFVKARHLKVYHLKGRFGRATNTNTSDGHIKFKTTWRHIKQQTLDDVISVVQASYQKNMFNMAGVDLQSQEAYEFASKGMLRSKFGVEAGPMIYGIKCINFDLPEFTLEVHCINEDLEFLAMLVNDIGIEVRSSAMCTQARRIRWGNFTLSNVNWLPFNPEVTAGNISICRSLLAHDKLLRSANIESVEESTDTFSNTPKSLPDPEFGADNWGVKNSTKQSEADVVNSRERNVT